MTRNRLYCGDNLEILATIEKESVDLIYIDPPFFSNRYYEIIWGDEAEISSLSIISHNFSSFLLRLIIRLKSFLNRFV